MTVRYGNPGDPTDVALEVNPRPHRLTTTELLRGAESLLHRARATIENDLLDVAAGSARELELERAGRVVEDLAHEARRLAEQLERHDPPPALRAAVLTRGGVTAICTPAPGEEG